MPYIKQVVRKDTNGNVIRYDYYLAENKREGNRVKTTILRKLSSSSIEMKEQDRNALLHVKEPKEHDKDVAMKNLLELFHSVVEKPTVASAMKEWIDNNPEKVQRIRKLEEML